MSGRLKASIGRIVDHGDRAEAFDANGGKLGTFSTWRAADAAIVALAKGGVA